MLDGEAEKLYIIKPESVEERSDKSSKKESAAETIGNSVDLTSESFERFLKNCDETRKSFAELTEKRKNKWAKVTEFFGIKMPGKDQDVEYLEDEYRHAKTELLNARLDDLRKKCVSEEEWRIKSVELRNNFYVGEALAMAETQTEIRRRKMDEKRQAFCDKLDEKIIEIHKKGYSLKSLAVLMALTLGRGAAESDFMRRLANVPERKTTSEISETYKPAEKEEWAEGDRVEEKGDLKREAAKKTNGDKKKEEGEDKKEELKTEPERGDHYFEAEKTVIVEEEGKELEGVVLEFLKEHPEISEKQELSNEKIADHAVLEFMETQEGKEHRIRQGGKVTIKVDSETFRVEVVDAQGLVELEDGLNKEAEQYTAIEEPGVEVIGKKSEGGARTGEGAVKEEALNRKKIEKPKKDIELNPRKHKETARESIRVVLEKFLKKTAQSMDDQSRKELINNLGAMRINICQPLGFGFGEYFEKLANLTLKEACVEYPQAARDLRRTIRETKLKIGGNETVDEWIIRYALSKANVKSV